MRNRRENVIYMILIKYLSMRDIITSHYIRQVVGNLKYSSETNRETCYELIYLEKRRN